MGRDPTCHCEKQTLNCSECVYLFFCSYMLVNKQSRSGDRQTGCNNCLLPTRPEVTNDSIISTVPHQRLDGGVIYPQLAAQVGFVNT